MASLSSVDFYSSDADPESFSALGVGFSGAGASLARGTTTPGKFCRLRLLNRSVQLGIFDRVAVSVVATGGNEADLYGFWRNGCCICMAGYLR